MSQEEPRGVGPPIRLLVACALEKTARDLCTRIRGADGQVRAQATDLDGVLERTMAWRPDVLLLEYCPAAAGIVRHTLAVARAASPRTRVLLLCEPWTGAPVADFVREGASGCLQATNAAQLQAKAVRTVHGGDCWFKREELLCALRAPIRAQAAVSREVLQNDDLLTAREREILALVSRGMSNKEIGVALDISPQTVKTHLHHIYGKVRKSGRYKVCAWPPAHAAVAADAGAGAPR